jgi:hypothetical protein
VYDNACNLKRYLKKRINKHSTDRMKNMKNIRFVVDKLHMAGHKEDWCKLHCDPARFPDLLKINTVVCEQINYWLGKYKYSMKNMNVYRFNFFLYIILNQYNKIKCAGKYSVFNPKMVRTLSKKRKFEQLESSTDNEDI